MMIGSDVVLQSARRFEILKPIAIQSISTIRPLLLSIRSGRMLNLRNLHLMEAKMDNPHRSESVDVVLEIFVALIVLGLLTALLSMVVLYGSL